MTLSTFSKLCIWNHRTDTSRPEHRHARGVPRHLCAAPMNSLPDHLWQSWVKSVFLKFISSKSRARTALLWHFREARITFLALLFFFFGCCSHVKNLIWILRDFCQQLHFWFSRQTIPFRISTYLKQTNSLLKHQKLSTVLLFEAMIHCPRWFLKIK